MPKLWNATIDAHRREVREAILDTTWELATERGPAAVRMSEVAERTGIGRATLYKYFPDVESILAAWHRRQIDRHLDQLAEARDEATDPAERLRAVLATYARINRRRTQHQQGAHAVELVALLHPDDGVAEAQRRLHGLLQDVLEEAVATGTVRADMTPDELAGYCLHALTAAGGLCSDAAVDRLVALTLAALSAH